MAHDLPDLVARLEELRPDERDLVPELLAGAEVSDSALEPFLSFRDERYTRNLVHRGELFDVLVVCWNPGQHSPIHDHSNQLGWVRVLRGTLAETAYAKRRGAAHGDGGSACEALAAPALDRVGDTVLAAGPAVAAVDRRRAVHRLGNPAGEPAVSLHVYSRPYDSCLVYDDPEQRPRLVALAFDTAPADAPPAPRR